MPNPISQIRRITNTNGVAYDVLVFWCPGCEIVGEDGEKQAGAHMLPITDPGDGRPQWNFSGDVEHPTLSPSILSRVKYRRVGDVVSPLVCHSFMKQGMLEFLGDCTHQYANQTIPLPPLPDWLYKEYPNA